MEKKIEKKMKNLEEKTQKRSHEIEHKQIKNEMKRIEFEESRQFRFVKRKEESLKKGEKIVQVLEKNKDLEKRKIKEYYDKQEIISLRKEELEVEKLEEKRLKEEKRKQHQKRIDQVKSKKCRHFKIMKFRRI